MGGSGAKPQKASTSSLGYFWLVGGRGAPRGETVAPRGDTVAPGVEIRTQMGDTATVAPGLLVQGCDI